MDGWLIAFILLCVFFGPVYVVLAIIGLAMASAPGTAATMPIALLIFILILFGSPFVFFGYMALFRNKGIVS
ncbi:hypothetical protein PV-S19_0316 [Pacmanvirus S19]|nr:hypothetical protein PV-S19_0316 [Pacmanvirus S19]